MQLAMAHGAVDVLTQSMAFITLAVQLAMADGAVDVLMQSMAFRTSAVQLAMADGAVDVLMQSMAFRTSAGSLLWLTALLTCSHSHGIRNFSRTAGVSSQRC